MTEKHLALRDNIGTYEEEDKAYDLLTWLSWHLPVFVVASALLDLLLAVAYLKWLHPWKIILQDVSWNKHMIAKKQQPESLQTDFSGTRDMGLRN